MGGEITSEGWIRSSQKMPSKYTVATIPFSCYLQSLEVQKQTSLKRIAHMNLGPNPPPASLATETCETGALQVSGEVERGCPIRCGWSAVVLSERQGVRLRYHCMWIPSYEGEL